MLRLFRHISLWVAIAAAVTGCSIWSDYGADGMLSELSISVRVSDGPGGVLSKAVSINPGDYEGAMHDGEKMQTLRIVIVREDGTVEHNRFMDFYGSLKKSYISVSDISFEVYGPETKKVYLFVNENTQKTDIDGTSKVRLVDYDFDSLVPGSVFPADEIAGVIITLNNRSDEVIDQEVPSEALPMSECHVVEVPSADHHVELSVTRAATKFTYIFENNSNVDLSLEKLTVSKASRMEYYLPRTSQEQGYEVPNINNNDYYVFEKTFGNLTVPAGTVTRLERSFYLLEGKYSDSEGDRDASGNPLNYSMSVTLNGTSYNSYFPDVKQLPRNTHVVVVVSFGYYGTEAKVDWTVDVYPFGEVWLEPGFGQ